MLCQVKPDATTNLDRTIVHKAHSKESTEITNSTAFYNISSTVRVTNRVQILKSHYKPEFEIKPNERKLTTIHANMLSPEHICDGTHHHTSSYSSIHSTVHPAGTT